MPVHTRNKPAVRALTVATAAAAALLVWSIAVPVAGVELLARSGSGTQEVGGVHVLVVTGIIGLAGWALLEVLERRARNPARSWTIVALIVLVLSLVGPLGATTLGAALTLVALHLVTAAVLIVGLRRSATRGPDVIRNG